MCGSAMLAMDVSSTSMKTAIITVSVMSHGLWRGCQTCCGAPSGMENLFAVAVWLPVENEPEQNRRRKRENDCDQRNQKIRHAKRAGLNARRHGKSRTNGVVGGQGVAK